MDTDVNYISNYTGSSPTNYLQFSSVFFLFLFTTLSYKTPIMYVERRWQSDFGVSILVTTVLELEKYVSRKRWWAGSFSVPSPNLSLVLVFSPQSSHWTIIFHHRNIARNASKTRLQDVYFVFTLYYFLNITNYKVVTGPVTRGSNFLLVQKHFALVQD